MKYTCGMSKGSWTYDPFLYGGTYMKKSEIIAHFNTRAEEAKSVKDLDALYFDVVYSNLDNYIVNTYKYLINLKYENMLLKKGV